MARSSPVRHLVALFVLVHVVLVAAAALGGPPNLRSPSTPVEYYGKYLGVTQRWFMFGTVSAGTSRLEISVREDGDWRDVYVERSRDADWNARAFDHYRWREYTNHLRLKNAPDAWNRFVPWAAERVLTDFEDADAVRFRILRGKVGSPKSLRKHGGVRYRREMKSETVLRSDL